jgi:hypothetical protein
VIDTEELEPDQAARRIVAELEQRGLVPSEVAA